MAARFYLHFHFIECLVFVGSACPGGLRLVVPVLQIANFLCNGNYAVSGSSKACDVVEQIAKPDFKARMTVRLAVAGAFHTSFMEAAVDKASVLLLLLLLLYSH